MPAKRNQNRRRRGGRRASRRQGGARSFSSRASRPDNFAPRPLGVGRIFRVVRNWQQASLTLSSSTAQLGIVNLGVSAFSSAFDAFLISWDLARFDSIEVSFVPSWGVSVSSGAIPMIAVVPNYDDSTAPASFDFVAGAGGSIMRSFNRPIRRRCSAPGLLTPAIVSGTPATNALVLCGQWFNPSIVTITNMSVPLVKYAISSVATVPASGLFFINLRIHLSLAQPVMG